MTTLSFETAADIVRHAIAGPRSEPGRYVAVAVCDAGGHPMALGREANAAPLRAHIAQAKAATCIALGQPTRRIMDGAIGHETWFESVSKVADAKMGSPLIFSLGGVVIQDEDGAVLGAVGVAGEQGEQDERLAILGIESVGLVANANG